MNKIFKADSLTKMGLWPESEFIFVAKLKLKTSHSMNIKLIIY